MAHDAVNNSPKTEILTSLIGIVLLLVIIAGIAIFAWLRPAGDHFVEPVAVESVEQATLVEGQSEAVAPAQAENAGVDNVVSPVVGTTADSPTAAPAEISDTTTAPPDAEGVPEGVVIDIPAVDGSTAGNN